ncbi:MAG: hypothetical protein M3Y53_02890 [Thermoproteota archaeon]|nr:hypothetical protein [Thermoproteota archaeon]
MKTNLVTNGNRLTQQIKKQSGRTESGVLSYQSKESVVLTFWETRGNMDSFYKPDNKDLADFVESAKILFEQTPERNDYVVYSFKK